VKNVTGYDLHKLVVGSLGTLAVIVQVALKVRPLPRARRTVRLEGGLDPARSALDVVPGAAAVLASPSGIAIRLEGWPAEVDEQAAAIGGAVGDEEDGPFPSATPWLEAPVVAEVAVPPSRLELATDGEVWAALVGVGLAWVGLPSAVGELTELRERVRAAGGIAPVVQGPGGLGEEPVSAPEVQRRLKAAFDPNGVLAPGRGWGGI